MSAEEIIARYLDDPNQMGKTELAAVTMLKISDEMGDERCCAYEKKHKTCVVKLNDGEGIILN